MLGFRPLSVGKRKAQSHAPAYDRDIEDGHYDEKAYGSDDEDSCASSPVSSAYSSRQSSGSYDINPNNIESRPLAPNGHNTIRKIQPRPRFSAYSYRNPRACTRYFGLAITTTLLFFFWFLFSASWDSIRSAELGLNKAPPPPPIWESFPFLKRYHGGIRTLINRDQNVPEYPTKQDIDPELLPEGELKESAKEKRSQGAHIADSMSFNPYPDYRSSKYLDQYGPVETCYLDANDTIKMPGLRAYKGVTDGMPENVLGSYETLGLRNDVCFERFGRLGPYGLGYSKRRGGTGAGMEGHREGIEDVWKSTAEVDYRQVNWAEAIDRCLEKNAGRFQKKTTNSKSSFQNMAMQRRSADPETTSPQLPTRPITNSTVREQPKAVHNKLIHRTAVLIRTWSDYEYDDEDIMHLRSMISELTLASGGEYQVHFLIHVKDDNKQIWADEDMYAEVLKNALPAEFAGMGTLWSERQMGLIYGGLEDSKYRDLPVHGAYRSTYMPVTYFSHQHPEFEYFWHWEMDARYTGHYYHLFEQVSKWTEAQPRKGLWERNARFYVPSVHGTWEEFKHMVRVQTEHGTNNHANRWSSHLPPNPHVPETRVQKPEKPIWGPELPQDYPDIEIDEATKPNTSIIEDNYVWGVGEPADLIVFNPLFDPDQTNWILAQDITGYNTTNGPPPRRTAINTSGRLSRRLLETMHREQAHFRHTMFSEMWPATCSLHHGLKAVYAPHPVFIDRKWPTQYLAAIFNNGRNGASGGAKLSIFSEERQHNFLGTTWYYNAGFAPNLWKRWLGYKVNNDGGEEEEVAGEGRMCLPAMLLHPIKQVDLVQERVPEDTS